MTRTLFNAMKIFGTQSYALFGTVAFAIALLALPSFSFAASTTTTDGTARGVCLRVVSLDSAFKENLAEAGRVYAKVANTRTAKLRAQAVQRGFEDAATRKSADDKFKQYITTLRTSVSGQDDKTAAIDTFYTVVTAATTQRRSTVDSAQKIFMTGVQSLADARSKQVQGEALDFQNEVSGAFSHAQSSCEAGADPEEVRNTLHETLAAVDQKYQGQFADQHVFNEGLQGLTTIRTGSLLAASSVFSTALDQASQALHNVLQY
jgi:hypothetical protein